jgi:hypothetical protein
MRGLSRRIVFGQEDGRHAGVIVAGRGFCFIANKPPEPSGPWPIVINTLTQFSASKPIGPKQQLLDLKSSARRKWMVGDGHFVDGTTRTLSLGIVDR